ncbi:MAG TPA: hypothetical protein VH913_16870 [Hyphomicrobiaceae bacterium]|jgi:hypothetical protein
MTRQFLPAESDRTAAHEWIVSATGFSFWWGGGKYTVQPGIPGRLTRAQLDALEKPGADGSAAPTLFQRVKFPDEQAVHYPVWHTPSSNWTAPGIDEKVAPTALPKDLPAQVAVIADEYIAYPWHGQTLTVRPRERTILERDQVRFLASLSFPFKVVD